MRNKFYLKYIILIITVISFIAIIQFKAYEFLCTDVYYHAKMAQLILDSGKLVEIFPWLQYTILNDNFVEHHLLFHILLLPFFKILEPFLAAKIATIVFATTFFIVFFVILKKLNIKSSLYWTLFLLFSSSLFIFRLNLLRAQSLALILLLIGIYLLIKKYFIYLIPLTIFYVWLFDGFIILGIVIAIKSLMEAYYLFKTKNYKLISDLFYPILCYLAGIAIAIILNPYFPKNIYHLFFHLYHVALKDPFSNMPVGIEWYMSTPWFLISSSLIIIILLVIAIFIILLTKIKHRKVNKTILFLFLNALVFFLLTIVVRKMIEYSAPLIILLAAYVYTNNYIAINKYFGKLFLFKNKYVPKLLIVFFLLSAAIYNFQAVYFNLNNDKEGKINTKKAGIWIKENIPAKEIIYHLDWSESPQLLFYNDQNYYIAGLDPNFMKEYNYDLYRKWHQLFSQQSLENSHQIIKQDFKANYAYINKDFSEFVNYTKKDLRFATIYENENILIYKIK